MFRPVGNMPLIISGGLRSSCTYLGVLARSLHTSCRAVFCASKYTYSYTLVPWSHSEWDGDRARSPFSRPRKEGGEDEGGQQTDV